MTYKVIVEGGSLRFGAAHFITMGGKCERLHGHNYGVSAIVEAPLGADSFVVDFVLLKQTLRAICDDLDHHFLLPMHNEHLSVRQENEHWQIEYADRHYVFPARDVLTLPLDNVTAERLAEYIWRSLATTLRSAGDDRPLTISIGVEEAPGQTAWFTCEA